MPGRVPLLACPAVPRTPLSKPTVARKTTLLGKPAVAPGWGNERGQSHFRRTKIGTVPRAPTFSWSWPTASPISPAPSTSPRPSCRPGGGVLHHAADGRRAAAGTLRQAAADAGRASSPAPGHDCGRIAAAGAQDTGKASGTQSTGTRAALAHLERTLFGNPRHAQPATDTTGLEILAAASAAGEIEMIAARIKRLLVDGDAAAGFPVVRPGEIAVVFRRPQDAGAVLGEVMAAYGIPVALELGQPLARGPAAVALLRLLQLQADDWPLEALLALLGSNYFRPDWPEWLDGEAGAAVDRAIRHWQIPCGRGPLLDRLQAAEKGSPGREPGDDDAPTPEPGQGKGTVPSNLGQRKGTVPSNLGQPKGTVPSNLGPPKGTVPFSSNENWDSPRASNRDSPRASDENWDSPRAAAVLRRLAAALDELPERATLAGWGKAWQRLARQTGLLAAAAGDEAVWNCLQAVLREGDTLARWLGRDAAELDRAAALAALQDILASVRLRPAPDDGGRVRILSAASVRGLRVPYLFLAGLGEKSFPSPEREDRLYSEAEYQRLIAEGLPLPARPERSSDEMLLFYEAVTRATRRLWLSYPALDGRGQPLLPSPYLQEVEGACGKERIARTERTDLSPVPLGEEPFSAAEFRVKAVAAALGGDVTLLAGLLQEGARGTVPFSADHASHGAQNRDSHRRDVAQGDSPIFVERKLGQSPLLRRRTSLPGCSTSGCGRIATGSVRPKGCSPARRRSGNWRPIFRPGGSSAPRSWSSMPPARSAISSPRCWRVERRGAGVGDRLLGARPAGA